MFWPARCAACDIYLTNDEDVLCPSCRDSLRSCDKKCQYEGFEGGQAFFVYEGAIQEMITKWKFHADFHAQKSILRLVRENIQNFQLNIELPCAVIPVPPHIKRLRERGYDPAWTFAREFYRAWVAEKKELRDVLYFEDHCLVRHRNTRHQVRLGREERLHNLDNAFSLKKSAPSSVLLIDDVITTGATGRACGEVLRKGGTQFLYLLGLAQTSTDVMDVREDPLFSL